MQLVSLLNIRSEDKVEPLPSTVAKLTPTTEFGPSLPPPRLKPILLERSSWKSYDVYSLVEVGKHLYGVNECNASSWGDVTDHIFVATSSHLQLRSVMQKLAPTSMSIKFYPPRTIFSFSVFMRSTSS